MSSLENILNYIDKTTTDEIEKIKKENILICKKIIEKYKYNLKVEEEKMNKKIAEKKQEINKNFEIELKQYRNKAITNKKDEILTRIINLSIENFCNKNDKIYKNFIENLIITNIPNEQFTLIFGKKEYNKFNDMTKSINNIKKYEFSDNFNYGFKIKCQKYILDFDIENLFKENIEILKLKASEALCLEDIKF